MMPSTSPSEALDRVVSYIFLTSARKHRNSPPGAVIERLDPETLALLRDLRSRDIATGVVRDEVAWFDPDIDGILRARSEKLRFDRTLRRLGILLSSV